MYKRQLLEYLATAEAQEILNRWAGEIFGGIADNITITSDQIRKLASELAAGYQAYAAAGNGPDPSKMPEYFLAYLSTEDGQQRLTEGLAGVVDIDSLGRQISAAVESYMPVSYTHLYAQSQYDSRQYTDAEMADSLLHVSRDSLGTNAQACLLYTSRCV